MNDNFTDGATLWLAQATLLLGCFWAVYGTMRSHPRARVMLSRTVSVALLALPLLALAPVPPILHLPAPMLSGMTINRHASPAIPPQVIEISPPTGEMLPLRNGGKDIRPEESHRQPVLTVAEALMLVWLLGSSFLLVRWLMALKRVQRLAQSAQEPPEWTHEIQSEIALHLHLAAQVKLNVIDAAGSPLLLGPRLVILLPRRLIEEDAQEDFVPSLCHEMVHVKEGDWWWSQWLRIVTAILWPIPPVWFLRQAHDSAAEIVCDSIAASLVGGTELYAGTLARQSLHALDHSQLATVPMVRRSGIRQRIDLLLSDFALPAFSRRSMMMTGLVALVICGALSGIRVAAAGDTTIAPATPKSPTAAVAPAVPLPVPVPAGEAVTVKPAVKEIEPYGGIFWNDGVFQVIQKLKKIEGITTINWWTSGNQVPIDLTTITKPEELNAVFEKWLQQYTYPFGGKFSNTPLYNSIITYKDASGSDKKCFSSTEGIGNELSAGPIILAGHPFKLWIYFNCYPGFAVQFPDRVVNFANSENAVAPLAITTVALGTDIHLSDEARNTIADKLITKYGIVEENQIRNLKLGSEVLITRGAARLNVFLNNNSITYDYPNRDDLIGYYQNLLTKLAEQAAKKGPDGMNGL